MNEAIDIFLPRDGIGNGLCSQHVRLVKNSIVENRSGDVALRRKMNDHIRAAYQLAYEIAVRDVAVPKLESFRGLDVIWNIIRGTRIRQRVKHDDMVLRIFAKNVFQEIAADESGAAGNKDCFQFELWE